MRKKLLITIVALAAVGGVAAQTASTLLQPERLKGWIETSVLQSTGRTLSIGGKLKLVLSISPTIIAEQVRLSNATGGTRKDMARADRIEARIYLPALLHHRVEITRLWLKGPEILFEQVKGKPNWVFDTPPDPGQPKQPAPPPGTQPASPYGFLLRTVQIKDGLIEWNLPRHKGNLGVRSLSWVLTPALDALSVQGVLIHADHPLTLNLHAVPQGNDLAPWKVQTTFSAAGGTFEDHGTAALNGQYDLQLKGQIPHLDALSPWVPGVFFPPLEDVQFSAKIVNKKGLSDPPDIQQATAHIGGMPLEQWLPGWRIGTVDASIARLGQPLQVTGEAWWGKSKLPFTGTVGMPKDPTQPSIVPIDLKGFAPAIPLHDAALKGRIGYDAARNAIVLQGMSLTSKEADLTTDTAIGLGDQATVDGHIQVAKLDADALLPSSSNSKNAFAWLDTPLPWAALQSATVDLTGQAASVRLMQHSWKGLAFAAKVDHGKLHPLTLSTHDSGSNIAASATADADGHKVGFTVTALSVPLALLVDLAGGTGHATGAARVNVALTAQGTTPRQMKTTLNGTFDVALQGGTIANADLPKALNLATQALNIPQPRNDDAHIECVSIAGSFVQGEGRLKNIAVDTSRLKLAGDGLVNFNDDTLALKLRPLAIVAGSPVTVPVLVKGPFSKLSAGLDANGLDQAGLMLDALFGGDTPHICRHAGFLPPTETSHQTIPTTPPGK